MSRIRFAFIKDPHFDTTGPASRKDNYLEDLTNLMDQVGVICQQMEVSHLLIPGDVFLREEPVRVSHTLVSYMVDYFKSFPVPIAGIIGNHDARKGLEHYESYPISVLIKAGVYQFLDRDPLIIEKDGFKVKVGGVSYQRDTKQKLMEYKKQDEDYLVLLAHCFLDTKDKDFFGEPVYGYDSFDGAEFDVLAVGHEHVNNGIHTVKNKHFINTGQISRVSNSKGDRELVPTMVVFSLSKEKGFKSTEIPLTYKSAEEIFHDEEDLDWKEYVPDMQDFGQQLEQALVVDADISIEDIIKESDFDDKVKSMVLSYMAGAV